MSDTTMMFKLFFCLGIVYLVVGLLYPGQDAAWNALGNQISTGPQLPTFNNPYSPNSFKIALVPIGNDTFGFSNIASVTGCALATYWKCVGRDDGASSYVTLNDTGNLLNVNMTKIANVGTITAVTLTLLCREVNDPSVPWNNWHTSATVPVSPVAECPRGTIFQSVTTAFDLSLFSPGFLIGCAAGASMCDALNTGIAGVLVDSANVTTGKTVDITFMELDVFVTQTSPACGALDTGCALQRFFDPISKAMQFVFNGIVFIFTYVVVLFSFVGTLVALVFIGLFTTTTFILTGLGAPPLIANLIRVLFVAIFASIAYLLLKHIASLIGAVVPT